MISTFLLILVCVSSINTLSLDEFFPFGPEVNDVTIQPNDDESEGPLRLPHVFPYFDNNHRQIWIANNGLFSFLSPIHQFVPDPFPLANDSRLIAGFWTDIDTQTILNDTGNKVYYQIYNNTLLSNITLPVFDKIRNYVRSFFPQQHLFEPKMIITGTWYRVGAFANQISKLNTFQIVLSTDGDRSFVFFLYHDIQWISPSNDSESYAQAGFNAGDGITFEILPYSNSKDIAQLVNMSNVNIPGLFAFRVDTDKINVGGCNDNVTIASFRPRTGSQFGSTALNINGPCFRNETIVKCRFGSSLETVNSLVIDDFQSVCLTPFASVHGRLPVSVSIDNGMTYISAGTFTYAPLQFGSDEVTIEMEDADNLLTIGQYVKLSWHFSEMVRNTFPNNTKIDIELWKISLNQQSELQKDNQRIILVQDMNLNNWARVQIPQSISYISTCFIRVVAHFNSQIYAGLNTGILIVRSHPSLAPELCQNWAAQQPEPSTWNNDNLLRCPMTRWQAVAAGRCCYEPDRQCYKDNPHPNNCWLHQARSGHDEPSAIECFVSITSNHHGAGTECCYDNNGTIITRGTGAGTDNRYHPSTLPVQHFFHDTLPYLQCCMMGTYAEACNAYMYYRPPRKGSNTMDGIAVIWGDPHFATLDGISYTFNGYGEYTYLAISNDSSPSHMFDDINQSYIFISQIRTIPLLSTKATVTKGFAARSIDDTKSISVTISRRERLILHHGNESLDFEDNINTLFIPGLTITRFDGNNNSHFSLSWSIGVTIEINVIKITSPSEQLVLNIGASLSGIYRNKTYGLLGTFDGIPNNDLRSKNGSIISKNASLEQIHKSFGVTWAINPSKSLFYYESDQSPEFFEEKNRNFTPSFTDPTTINNSSIRTICKINATSSPSSWNIAQRTCYYDLSVTNDINFAQSSLNTGNELLSIRKNQRNPPSFISSLPLSMNLTRGDQVQFNMSASSEYRSNIIVLSALHLPKNAMFDKSLFKWIAIQGEHYLSIEAHDTTYNLKSKHDITFNVNAAVNSGNGSIRQFNQASFIILILQIMNYLAFS